METPKTRKILWISPIWILPVLALVIGGWLLYKSITGAGINILVHFEEAKGVIPGRTRVIYRGIPIGTVRDIEIDRDLGGVSLYIEIDKRAKGALVKDTKFWLVKPEVSAGRIRGLNTLVSGTYVGIRPGTLKVQCRRFDGLPGPPPVPLSAPGLHIKLRAGNLRSIQSGSQIYFRDISIGSVQGYTLEGDGSVLINAYIEPKYAHLVKASTRFWNASGITLKGNLYGFKLHIESLASLIYGGIGLYTPKSEMDSPCAKNGQVFTLYPDAEDAGFGIHMTLQLSSAKGLRAGVSRVIYRGFEMGTVTGLAFNQDKRPAITADIVINPEAEFILRKGTRFWIVTPKFSITGVKNLETLIKGTYITLKPGGGKFCDHFVAQEEPNMEEILAPGSSFRLVTRDSRSLSIGAPILFRDFKVGEITGLDLAPKGDRVLITIFVYKKYIPLVRPDSVFWKTGGVKINAGLKGLNIQSGTVTSLLEGGIAFTDPDTERQTAKRGPFILYESYQEATDAVPALRSQGLLIHLLASDLGSIAPGSPILYKQIEVGKITGFRLDGRDIVLDAFIQKRYADLISTTDRFYNISGLDIKGNLSGIHVKMGSLKSVVIGGIGLFIPSKGKEVRPGHSFRLYRDYQDALDLDKTEVIIRFTRPYDIRQGTEVRCYGMTIGRIKEIRYDRATDSVVARAFIDRDASIFFRKGTRIWLVTPKFELSGIRHLDTVVTGPYIAVRPGRGRPCLKFVAADGPPPIERPKGGLDIVLETPRLGSLKKGSPVYYRQIQIGSVTGYELAPTAQDVWVHVNICRPYTALVHTDSKFWNVSGIRLDAGIFSGIQIDTDSLESIVAGGIAMATPETKGHLAPDNYHFILHREAKKKWLAWRPRVSIGDR